MPDGMTLLSDPAVAVSRAKVAAKDQAFCAAAWYTRGMRRGYTSRKQAKHFRISVYSRLKRLELLRLQPRTTCMLNRTAVTAATHNVHAESCALVRERMYRYIRNKTVLELLLGGIIDRKSLTWQAESCTGKDPRRTTDECRGAEGYIVHRG